MEDCAQNEVSDLKKGIIYCIVCNITGERYYGSTFKKINKRINDHKCKNNSCISKQIIERGNYSFEILMECYVPNKDELHKIESSLIRNNHCINIRDSIRLENEKKEYDKNYRENNKEKMSVYSKNYYNINAERVKIRINNRRSNALTIQCECGGHAKEYSLTRHYRSKKHQKWLETQQQNQNQN